MNAPYNQEHAPYQHHVQHDTKPVSPQQTTPQQTEPNPFAVHGDPSQHTDPAVGEEAEASRRVHWTRLADLYADPRVARLAVRGVDLHAHLLRTVRNAPFKAAKAARRRLAPSSAPARRLAAGVEGVEL
ncbi:hypothetical protein APR04_003885 [Promicromonospora umidemergens]|uniref:Uncharacterized protein n=2 Tax=Promicromonospora TaxID=43676 RepID=A0ABP8XL58_9MICO|nr:hypothetical protein [Promicromonospora umidemergens]MCP2284962.1 hypothetical protein [Promicromonospora umidemergens]